MANTYKDIVIIPFRGDVSNVPVIRFSSGNATTNSDMNVRFYATSNGSLSFEGSSGQVFSVTNDLIAYFSGNVGIGITTPTSNLHVVGTANITSNLIVQGIDVIQAIANSSSGTIDTTARDIANSAFAKANAAITVDTLNGSNTAVGSGANAFSSATVAGANAFASATIAGSNTAVGAGANAFASATIAGSNTAVGAGANNFMIAVQNGSNTAVGAGANAFASATVAGANAFTSATIAGANTAVGVGANTVAIAAFAKANAAITVDTLNGSNTAVGAGANAFASATVAGANTAVGAGANAFSSATVAGANTAIGSGANAFTSATIAGANTAIGSGANAFATAATTGANAFTSATISGANTAVGTGANNFMIAVQNGSNTAVGTGANAFSSATIAGANAFASATIAGSNTAVGAGANAFMIAVQNGSNTAVGSGANAFASATVAGANAFASATIAGANTAIGSGANAFASATVAGANAFASATIAGANTAIGSGANAYMIAVQNGSNTAVGTGANAYSNGTFVKLIAPSQTITGDLTIVGNLSFSGNTSFTNVTTIITKDPLIYLANNNLSDIIDIGFIGQFQNATGSNVFTGLYREHADKMYYLFSNYDRTVENNHIGALSNNMTLAVLNADIRTSNLSLAGANLLLTLAGANTAVGAGANAFTSATVAGANAFASATIAGANTAVGTGANNFMIAVQNGSNTAVGAGANAFATAATAGVGAGANAFTSATVAGANAFTSATIAGANTAIGSGANAFSSATIAGANAFTSATISGANTAVGTGANNFMIAVQNGSNTAVGAGANAFTSATIAGANTAVGAGANAFTSATISGANTAIGSGANAFTSATIAGANTAIGSGANTVSVAAFAKANTALANTSGISFNGNLNFPSGNVGIGTNSPTSPLHVIGATFPLAFIERTSTVTNEMRSTFVAQHTTTADMVDGFGADVSFRIKDTAGVNNEIANFGARRDGADNSGRLSFYTYLAGVGFERMVVKANGNVGIGISAPTSNLHVVGTANITSNLVVQGADIFQTIAGSNTAVGTGANNFMIAVQNGSNTAVGTGANAFTSATVAGANAFTSATISGANTAVGAGANAFMIAVQNGSNTAVGAGANAFTSATIAGANTAVGAGANAFATAATAGVGAGANAFSSATIAGANAFTSATISGANTAVGSGANAFATAATTGANNFMIAVQNGSNTAVGAGANAFTSATIAGANAFTSATIAGANTAVGAGANAFATAATAGANAYMIAVQNGSNTAVGAGANAFTSATISGANTAVGAGANTVGVAAFAKANTGAVPTGVIFERPWNSTLSSPTGYLRLDGSAYTKTAYPDLSTLIGTPTKIGNYTVLFQNTSLLLSDVHNANGVLFHNGTTTPNNGNAATANSIVYSRDGGTVWISAAAQGLSAAANVGNAQTHTGQLSTTSRVASNGIGTYVITNAQSNGSTYRTLGGTASSGNAFIMYATAENLNTWTKFVFSGPSTTALGAAQHSASHGAFIHAVAFGGIANRFVALFRGSFYDTGCCSFSYLNSKVFFSNNGTTLWSSTTTAPANLNIDKTQTRAAHDWIDVVASANGFIAVRAIDVTGLTGNGYSNTVITSDDGIVWTDISSTIAAAGYDRGSYNRIPSFANGLFILAASTASYDSSNVTRAILTSTNRTTWTRTDVDTSVTSTGPFSGRKIYHNGYIYYTSGTDGTLYYSTDLSIWGSVTSGATEQINIIASANVGNNIYGHGFANGVSASDFSRRMSIGSINHNTYNVSTQFPLPFVSSNTVITRNPTLVGTSFIKT